jgi:hypothetical protein
MQRLLAAVRDDQVIAACGLIIADNVLTAAYELQMALDASL